jgi:hypothetical protein
MELAKTKIFIKRIIMDILVENIIVRYEDIRRWEKTADRVIVYGRRKTGKSFFIKNFTEWDEYFFIKRDGGAIDLRNKREVSYEYLKDMILESNKKVVVDEFQRLPEDFPDFLHANAEKAKLVLIASTLYISRKILSYSSPLLGAFEEFRLDIIDERDILRNLSGSERGSELVEKSVYLREPWIIGLVKGNIREELARILKEEKNTFESLIGEIFVEEERALTKVYVSILTAVASGKAKSSEISSFLFSKKLIEKDDPSLIQSYLKVLQQIGLIEKVNVYNKRFDQFRVSSPLLDLYFYLEGKYGFSELDVPLEEIHRVVNEKIPYHVEHFCRGLLSKLYGLKPYKILDKSLEIDIVLGSFSGIDVIAEVKWKDRVERDEIRSIEEKLSAIKANGKFLIVKSIESLESYPEGVKVLDPEAIKHLVEGKALR